MEAGPTKPDEVSDPADPWRPIDQSTDSSIRSPLISRIVVFGVICFGVIVAVRLGPALLGQQVLAGTDVLQSRFPWSDAGPFPTPQNWYMGDTVDATLPTYLQVFERLWSGDLALWSSLAGPGQRLIAIGNSPTLTPVSIWWMLMPTDYAAGFVKLTQLAAAFAGMALWLRRAGLSWAAGVKKNNSIDCKFTSQK